jgi:multidrug efflux pump subunit AcrA (membrane-fusion protein)
MKNSYSHPNADIELTKIFFEKKYPLAFSLYVYSLSLLLIIGVLWACFAKIDVLIKANGVLRLATENTQVKNIISGRVINKTIKQGAYVKRGDVLWEIDVSSLQISLDHSNAQLQMLRERYSSLTEYRIAIIGDFQLNNVKSDYAIQRLKNYLIEYSQLELQVQLALGKLDRECNKPQPIQIPVNIRDAEIAYDIAKKELDSFVQKEIVSVSEEIFEINEVIAELESRIKDLDYNISFSKVLATQNGVFEFLRSFDVGDYLSSNEEVGRIIPDNSYNMKVELYIDPKDIAEIKPGMAFLLKFKNLASSEFGQVRGKIEQVSADSLLINGGTVFIAQGVLDRSWVINRNKYIIELKAGMSADAQIIIRQKTIMQFILGQLELLVE